MPRVKQKLKTRGKVHKKKALKTRLKKNRLMGKKKKAAAKRAKKKK